MIALIGLLPNLLMSGSQKPLREVKLKLLLKLLTVNQKNPLTESDTVRIDILYDPSDPASVQEAVDLREICLLNPDRLLKNYVISLQVESWRHFLRRKSPRYQGVILVPGKKFPVQKIIDFSRRKNILAMSLHPELLAEGVSASVDYSKTGLPRIMLNLEAVLNNGITFGPEILQMAEFYQPQ